MNIITIAEIKRGGMKTPDALQAACALSFAEPCTFVTGDAGFARVPNLIVCQVAVAPA